MCPPLPGKPYIRYTEGDSVTFMAVESTTDFHHVVADYPRDVKLLHPFVPRLPSAHVTEDGIRVLPVLPIKITVFPNSGIFLGSTYCHAVGDGKSFMHFMRSWTSVCRSGGDLTDLENSLPLINKDVIKDPTPTQDITAGKVRATFVLSRAHAERLKHLVTAVDTEQQHTSTFMVTCAIVWVCLIKSKESVANNSSHDDDDEKFYCFLFPYDGRNRLEFPVPTTYFGNCLHPCIVDVKKSELTREDGIVLAAKAIGRLTPVAGRLNYLFMNDFGWGRPRKVELTHIDYDGCQEIRLPYPPRFSSYMAQIDTVKVLDRLQVSPPRGSVSTISVPLTHFDISWLSCAKVQRLFFYEFPHPASHFTEATLPMLQRSLSLTLQHFYPFAANIMCPRLPGKPYIHYKEGDSVSFTVAESDADFNNVIADYPRSVKLLHPFIPQLPSVARVTEDCVRVIPVIAFQVTVFPNSGICIGSTYCHAVGDGNSFMQLMRCWKSINRNYWQWVSSCENTTPAKDIGTEKFRGTFVLGRAHADKLKHWVTAHCKNSVDSETCHVSTFVVTCAFIWVCLIKSKDRVSHVVDNEDDKFYYFLFPFDCRNRLEFPVPARYFGNCLKPGVVDIKKSELVGENGVVLAAKAIGKRIKEMERRSPKLQVYDTDFGWGRPCKVELTHIENDGAIALAECTMSKAE
ncbi:HXXXD-type acyl-transferase family protein, putative isoform 2 [Hibiscus syriacus]|uniref:HXXXD-type acyl-transferase family protein, putative isoform 2 n=1 Tax=Hibiscus syriacus TaxID=106335 RepID=A0A6A2XJI3_HIBSY|nr:HXXXD-type acyl-transferase family protein, putative isoform 2 [Hibiscus syriacus]